MKKRTFLKTSSAIVIGSFLAPFASCIPKKEKVIRKNWAGNLKYSTDRLHLPKTVEEVQELVKNCDKLRVLGSRHCFNNIADSTENQISTKYFDRVVALDEDSNKVTVEAGMSYGQLSPYLHEKGYALHNLASLPHISIAGACATATHGSGVSNGNLPTAVSAMEFINAAGDVVTLSREKDGEKFAGAVVGLGALGVVTKLTLDIQPTFNMRQDVYQYLPLTELENNFGQIVSSGYSVSLFTDWKSDNVNQVWIKRRIDDGVDLKAEPEFFGARLATRNVHPILELSAENCTEQMGVSGPWYDRLPHFRMEFRPSTGKELQTEYFVPRKHAMDAFNTLTDLNKQLAPLLMISEVRTIKEDDLWMSPCYKEPSVVFHFTWEQDWDALKKLLPVIEKELEPFELRPHWGKMFTVTPARLESLYKKLPDFRELITEYDPNGKFRNEYLQKYIFSS